MDVTVRPMTFQCFFPLSENVLSMLQDPPTIISHEEFVAKLEIAQNPSEQEHSMATAGLDWHWVVALCYS